ncbi:MAG: hypothetical protein LBL84_01740 [Candidatus Nomurabacteria bacterium]|jgi:hypothetical protein|nr:hypothetical protein [Candidatus Nomurabacteria bacterium]
MDKRIFENRVAIWNSLGPVRNPKDKTPEKLYIRKQPVAHTYFNESGVAQHATEPMTRFAKNYSRGKGKSAVRHSLFVFSFLSDKNVESQLDKIASELSDEAISLAVNNSSSTQFIYSDVYLKKEIS